MSKTVANVDILSDSWEGLIGRLNQLTYAMSTEVLTANITGANTGNSSVSRIAQLWGTFGANTVVVSTGLRGGNVGNVQALPIVANAEIYVPNAAGANVPMLKVGNSTVISIVDQYGLRAGNGVSNTVISNSSIISQSNSTVKVIVTPTEIKAQNDSVNATMTPYGFTAGVTGANQTHMHVGANVVIDVASVTVGNSTANAYLSSQELLVSNATHASSVREDGIDTDGTLGVEGTATLNGDTNANTVNVANTLAVAGNTNVNQVNIKNDYTLDVAAVTDVGSNTTAEQLIWRFPKASYSSGKLTVQVKNGNNTQITEIVLAHNTSNAYLTAYGTVSSPPSGNSSPLLATFSANINNANVELLIMQTQANSAVKIAGHLIK